MSVPYEKSKLANGFMHETVDSSTELHTQRTRPTQKKHILVTLPTQSTSTQEFTPFICHKCTTDSKDFDGNLHLKMHYNLEHNIRHVFP
jgi:hypothetical protein